MLVRIHKHYCAIDEVGACTCGTTEQALVKTEGWYGVYGVSAPKPMPDAEAVQSLVDVDHLASVQDRVEKLRKKGIVLCRVS